MLGQINKVNDSILRLDEAHNMMILVYEYLQTADKLANIGDEKLFYFRRLNSVKLRLSYRLRLCEYSKG